MLRAESRPGQPIASSSPRGVMSCRGIRLRRAHGRKQDLPIIMSFSEGAYGRTKILPGRYLRRSSVRPDDPHVPHMMACLRPGRKRKWKTQGWSNELW